MNNDRDLDAAILQDRLLMTNGILENLSNYLEVATLARHAESREEAVAVVSNALEVELAVAQRLVEMTALEVTKSARLKLEEERSSIEQQLAQVESK